ncbi:ParB N-terminal domain-containing protein [Halostagnicola kamekurae]|uniref:ParB N-terminal domain-containing protein n=1 Tax=Halostagnicola kamekurae TaxID=619731 RepID=UPI00158749AB|nr:ParB N-terminal domain-containing protein [Halostagnicola kamekurae]
MYEGYVEMVHHNRGSVIMHNCRELTEGQKVGSVFVRIVDEIIQLESHKEIQELNPERVANSPHYEAKIIPRDYHMRLAYRNGYTGSFPVARKLEKDHPRFDPSQQYELVNGHKRVAAMKRVGLQKHPFEVIQCTDEEAKELYELAHRDQDSEDSEDDSTDEMLEEGLSSSRTTQGVRRPTATTGQRIQPREHMIDRQSS